MTTLNVRIVLVCVIAFALVKHADAAEVQPRLINNSHAAATLWEIASSDPQYRAQIYSLRESARKNGRVRVVLKLAVPFAPELMLTAIEQLKQRHEISDATRRMEALLPRRASPTPVQDLPYVYATLEQSDFDTIGSISGIVGITDVNQFNWLRDFTRMRVQQAGRLLSKNAANATQELSISEKIVGGTVADPSTHPFQVGLLLKSVSNSFYAQFCGGALVAARYIVTAAHCSDSFKASAVQVLVGTQALDGSGQRIDVNRILIHPNWNRDSMQNDVAVWELAKSVTGIPFAALATTQPITSGTPLRATGWGTLSYQGNSPVNLQQVDLPFVPTVNGYCQSQSGVTSVMLCAGSAGKDSCQGDSGGPLTMNTGSGYNVLSGIVSFGNGCGYVGYPGVYANVAANSIYSFIQSSITQPSNTIQFSSDSEIAGEGQRKVAITITRSNGAGTASVRYSTSNSSAVAPGDYTRRSATVNFRKNQTSVTITINIKNDRVRESLEDFNVDLYGPSSGFSLGANTRVRVYIADND